MTHSNEELAKAKDDNWWEWADTICIDPSGEVFAFEGGAYWDGDNWIPVDDFDGLRYTIIAHLDHLQLPVPPLEDCKNNQYVLQRIRP